MCDYSVTFILFLFVLNTVCIYTVPDNVHVHVRFHQYVACHMPVMPVITVIVLLVDKILLIGRLMF